MAKYCTKCGKELEEGKPCECEKTKETTQNISNNLINILKGTFTKPYTTTKETTKESYLITSIIAIIASSVALCLVIVKVLKLTYANTVGAITSSFGYNTNQLGMDITQTLFTCIILVALFYFLYTTVAYIFTNKIEHEENSYKEIVASMTVPAIISTTFSLVSWILLTVFGFIGLIITLAGIILATYYRYQSLIISSKVKEDNRGYLILASQLISVVIVTIIFTSIIPNYTMFLG